ncbi:MAG: hypothetical protein KatS3mg062_0285 [Tepidiforma sp.]|nr:MAG: hypothetical protein KatS3mg062_0285 [Tepidiforma sp.]
MVQSCQRLEAYGIGPCVCDAPRKLYGLEALERLACVAAGLDSVILGEEQILGQVRSAFRDTRGRLRAAGDAALAAARDARRAFPSRSHAGHLLDRALSDLGLPARGVLLVLGTGAMGRLVAQRGQELGFDVLLAGRRDPGLGIRYIPLEAVGELNSADVVVGCLGSGAGMIDTRHLPPARLFLDLGTPRNFADGPGVPVVGLADLLAAEERRPHAAALRGRLAGLVSARLEARLARLSEDAQSPVGRFRMAFEHVRVEALQRAMENHPAADPSTVDRALRSAANRLLHDLTSAMRQPGGDELARKAVEALTAERTASGAGRGSSPVQRSREGAADSAGTMP